MMFRLSIVGFLAFLLTACSVIQAPGGLTEESAKSLRDAILQGDGYLVDVFTNPDKYSNSASLKANVNSVLKLVSKSGLNLQGLDVQAELGCTGEENSSVDKDGDGIPLDSFYRFECTAINDDGAGFIIKGEELVQDKDDDNAVSGFLVDLKNLEIRGFDGKGNESFAKVRLRVDLLWANPMYSADYDFRIEGQWAGGTLGSIDHAYTAAYMPDDSERPFAGGTINYSGVLGFAQGAQSYSLSAEAKDLHYTETCLASFDAGTRTLEDSEGRSLKIVYTSCRNAVATFDGVTLAAF